MPRARQRWRPVPATGREGGRTGPSTAAMSTPASQRRQPDRISAAPPSRDGPCELGGPAVLGRGSRIGAVVRAAARSASAADAPAGGNAALTVPTRPPGRVRHLAGRTVEGGWASRFVGAPGPRRPAIRAVPADGNTAVMSAADLDRHPAAARHLIDARTVSVTGRPGGVDADAWAEIEQVVTDELVRACVRATTLVRARLGRHDLLVELDDGRPAAG